MSSNNIAKFLKQTLLGWVGVSVVIIALIGFFTHSITNIYSVQNYADGSKKETFNRTTGTIEYVKDEYPNATVEKLEKGFPIKSTVVLLFGSYILFRKHRGKNTDTKSVRLLNALKNNKKVKLSDLSRNLGMDKQFIAETLPELNIQYGTTYSLHFQTNMVINNDSIIEWHLNSTCENCGGNADTNLLIDIHSESLACPYCDAKIHDAEFETRRKELKELFEYKQNKRRFNFASLPDRLTDLLPGFNH